MKFFTSLNFDGLKIFILADSILFSPVKSIKLLTGPTTILYTVDLLEPLQYYVDNYLICNYICNKVKLPLYLNTNVMKVYRTSGCEDLHSPNLNIRWK
jgi:hypothetical protein